MNLEEQLKEGAMVSALEEGQWRALVWAKLNKIEASSAEGEMQATKTNARVTRLEAWRNMAIGALAVITAVVVPLFVKVIGG